MEILHIIPSLAKGGAERVVIELANSAIQSGDSVTILTAGHVADALEALPLDSKVKRRVIGSFKSSRRSLYLDLFLWILREAIFLDRVDVIHCHLTYGSIAGSIIQCLRHFGKLRRPVVIETYHAVGMPISRLKRALHAVLIRDRDGVAFMAQDDYWIKFCNQNRALLTSLIPNGITFRKKLPCAAEIKTYREHRAEIPPTARLVVGTLGRLTPDRKPEIYVPIFAEISSLTGKDVHFLIAGAGPQLKVLQGLARQYGIEELVHFSGLAEDPAVAMLAMDLYLTVTVGEITGVAALEAASLGIPVLGYQISPETSNRNVGWVWSSNSPHVIAHEAVRLLSSPTDRMSVSAKQTQFIQKHHTSQAMAGCYSTLYQQAFKRFGTK